MLYIQTTGRVLSRYYTDFLIFGRTSWEINYKLRLVRVVYHSFDAAVMWKPPRKEYLSIHSATEDQKAGSTFLQKNPWCARRKYSPWRRNKRRINCPKLYDRQVWGRPVKEIEQKNVWRIWGTLGKLQVSRVEHPARGGQEEHYSQLKVINHEAKFRPYEAPYLYDDLKENVKPTITSSQRT